jgi:hypothetical protein
MSVEQLAELGQAERLGQVRDHAVVALAADDGGRRLGGQDRDRQGGGRLSLY